MKPRSPFIVSFTYDWIFFLAAPMLALGLGILVSDRPALSVSEYSFGGERDNLVGFFTGTIVHAHLVAVLFRSHGNASIRRLYPIRFLVVPVVLWLAIVVSPWIAVASTVVATFWDVWHSGAQTFGFARIYERNAGTPPELGRRLDFVLQQVLYAGPVLAGATLVDHLDSFSNFDHIGSTLLSSVPTSIEAHHRELAYAVIGVATVVIAVYVLVYWQLAKRGAWSPPWLKIWLVASTGFVSIYTWGFNSWGQAFLIMNLFHAVQYLALVWAMEGTRIAGMMRLPKRAAFCVYFGGVVVYGLGVQALDPDITTLWAITMVVSLMHFWYDAFVWSVRRAQV
ncbi:MAG TPA: hypothetical protein VMZ53_05760 [Kofleriaceae bacterium]|nr:hypothetical protein [Kofleriaceae bacterium]